MSVLVGENSYVTLEMAEEYIAKNYAENDAQRIEWDRMRNKDKRVYLLRAAQELERLPYRGMRSDPDQKMAFPRRFCGGMDNISPDAVMLAQVEEALELACPGRDTRIWENRTGAVESYSIGELSERYNLAAAYELYAQAILKSSRAQALVAVYTGGAYEVR